MHLYSYWRSQAAFRVRVALRLKGLQASITTLDLLKGDQFDAAYRKLNPEMVVPTLIDGEGTPLTQSLAILEYLEEKHPQPPLLPKDLRDRAHVRALAQMIASDLHPLVVPRVRKYLEHDLHLDEAARNAWLKHWMDLGSEAVEAVLARDSRTGRFCFGDQPTMADLCLAAHLNTVTALTGGKVPDAYPTLRRIFQNCSAMDAFAAEHPMKQPDAPKPHA